jgi:hypothetical protein
MTGIVARGADMMRHQVKTREGHLPMIRGQRDGVEPHAAAQFQNTGCLNLPDLVGHFADLREIPVGGVNPVSVQRHMHAALLGMHAFIARL